MTETNTPPERETLPLMGGEELSEAIGGGFAEEAAITRGIEDYIDLLDDLLQLLFIPLAALGTRDLTPEQEKRYGALLRDALAVKKTCGEIVARLSVVTYGGCPEQVSSMVFLDALRLGAGASCAVSLCHSALRLYGENGDTQDKEGDKIRQGLDDLNAQMLAMTAQMQALSAQGLAGLAGLAELKETVTAGVAEAAADRGKKHTDAMAKLDEQEKRRGKEKITQKKALGIMQQVHDEVFGDDDDAPAWGLTDRTLRNWNSGKGTPEGFTLNCCAADFAIWARKYYREMRARRAIQSPLRTGTIDRWEAGG